MTRADIYTNLQNITLPKLLKHSLTGGLEEWYINIQPSGQPICSRPKNKPYAQGTIKDYERGLNVLLETHQINPNNHVIDTINQILKNIKENPILAQIQKPVTNHIQTIQLFLQPVINISSRQQSEVIPKIPVIRKVITNDLHNQQEILGHKLAEGLQYLMPYIRLTSKINKETKQLMIDYQNKDTIITNLTIENQLLTDQNKQLIATNHKLENELQQNHNNYNQLNRLVQQLNTSHNQLLSTSERILTENKQLLQNQLVRQ